MQLCAMMVAPSSRGTYVSSLVTLLHLALCNFIWILYNNLCNKQVSLKHHLGFVNKSNKPANQIHGNQPQAGNLVL